MKLAEQTESLALERMGVFGIHVCIDGEVSAEGGSITVPTCCEVEKVQSLLESEPPAPLLW